MSTRHDNQLKKILFTDYRHICCGSLSWRDAKGVGVPLRLSPDATRTPVYAHYQEGYRIPTGIRLEAQPATKVADPINRIIGERVIHDQGVYRSWYMTVDGMRSGIDGRGETAKEMDICHVESADGMKWSEPDRCRIDVPGQSFAHGSAFLDPLAPPDQRYKFVYDARVTGDIAKPLLERLRQRPARYLDLDRRILSGRPVDLDCFFVATSPDGLHWTPVAKPLFMHKGDTENTFLFDAAIGKYVLYTRGYRYDRRVVLRVETVDFFNWEPFAPALVIEPRLEDPPDYDVYTNAYCEYPGAPQYRLMFPMFFHHSTERSDVRLYTSTDGLSWSQVPGGPVLSPGETGAWDSEFISVGKDLVPLGRNRVGMPYQGTCYPHKYPRWPEVFDAMKYGWAWWPEDRLCAVKADGLGEFCTLPLTPAGRTLAINFRTPAAGLVQVGIAGIKDRAVDDCDPLSGDSLARVVSWNGQTDIAVPDGEPVIVQIRMRQAELFSLQWI